MIRLLLLAAALGLAVFYYFFFGAGPTASEMFGELPWWRPKGWALRWLPAKGLADMTREGFPAAAVPIGIFMAPAIVLFCAGLALLRDAASRALLCFLTLTACVFVYYGYMAEGVWRFFDWRFAAVVTTFCALTSTISFSPSLFGSALRAGTGVAALLLVVSFAVIFALSTEITGTSSALAFNISPWPILTLFGLLLVGAWIAAVHASSGLGIWLGRLRGGAGGLALCAICAFAAGTTLGFLVFSEPGARVAVGLSALAVALLGFATTDADEGARYGRVRLAVGLFVFAAIFVSNTAASAFQSRARDETALKLLVALEDFKKAQQGYPDRIEDLVPDYLPEVPRPRIGLLQDSDDAFTYTGFGDSYALEFASVLWVQCQYSPPFEYVDEEEEEADEEANPADWEGDTPDVAAGGPPPSQDDLAAQATLAEHGLDGSWSCAETPPTLW